VTRLRAQCSRLARNDREEQGAIAEAISIAEVGKLRFPYPDAPDHGVVFEICDDILWLRLPLPFQLDHVNVYLVRDHDAWVIIDTGISIDASRAAWDNLFNTTLRGFKISKVIATHFHPDHIGLAGWLCDRFQTPLLTSLSSYMSCRVISLDPHTYESPRNRFFYSSHGLDDEAAQIVSTSGHAYLRWVEPLPETFRRLVMGDVLRFGNRTYRVITGEGHAAEQVMLFNETDKLLFVADQVLEGISPNVAVWAGEPDGDPLGHYLRSLRLLIDEIPDDVLVLPGHKRPFYGLHARSLEIIKHHEARCRLILEACRNADHSIADMVPLLFQRKLDAHQLGFAFAETLAHANRLVRRGELRSFRQGDRIRFRGEHAV
jgi:glyoxylase-like metal-dependent hydrolase (beta-lactamase superfamily II)